MKVAQIIIASALFAAAAGAQAAPGEGADYFANLPQSSVSRAEVAAQARADAAEKARRGYVSETNEYRQTPLAQTPANAQSNTREAVRAGAREPRSAELREIYIG